MDELDEEVVGVLTANGSPAGLDEPIPDDSGNTVLHVVVRDGKNKGTRVLLGAEADPNIKNKEGFTPLHFAAIKGNFAAAKFLLEVCAEVDVKDNDDHTPMWHAKQFPDDAIYNQVVKALEDAGADMTDWPEAEEE